MPKRILVVEDDVEMCDIWRMAFEKAGYEVITINDSGQAMAWLTENPMPDALVTDYHMPMHTGEAVLDHLQSVAPQNTVVKVMVTANHNAQQDKVNDKVDLLLIKPVSPKDMVRFIDRFLAS